MADVPADVMFDARPAAAAEGSNDLSPGMVLTVVVLSMLLAGGVVLAFVSQLTQTGAAG